MWEKIRIITGTKNTAFSFQYHAALVGMVDVKAAVVNSYEKYIFSCTVFQTENHLPSLIKDPVDHFFLILLEDMDFFLPTGSDKSKHKVVIQRFCFAPHRDFKQQSSKRRLSR